MKNAKCVTEDRLAVLSGASAKHVIPEVAKRLSGIQKKIWVMTRTAVLNRAKSSHDPKIYLTGYRISTASRPV